MNDERPEISKEHSPGQVSLQALLLADHIYRDQGSGKYLIAGTFHQMNVAAFPANFDRTIGVFVSLSGLEGKADIDLGFLDASNGQVLMQMRPLEVSSDHPHLPVEFAVEVPPLPLPHAGRYQFQLTVNGSVLGTVAVLVRGPEEQG